MKKKEIIKCIVIMVILVAMILLVSCSFRGCNTDEPIDVQVELVLQEIINEAIENDQESDELLSEAGNRSGFELLSYTETETGVLVTFLVYAPDLYTVVKEIDENYVFETEEEMREALIEAMGKAQMVEREVTIEFRKTENGYEPILTIEFIDAFYGGALKLYNEMLINNSQGEVVE